MEYNKKEQLFDKINGLRLTSTNASDTLYNRGVVDAFRRTNEFFDEELIPEVPQYVIDWYEENKDNLDYNLWNYIMDWEDTEEDNFKRWVNNSKDAFQTIINMHQFGYKNKEEKKYLVTLKGVINGTKALKHNVREDSWYMGTIQETLDLKLFHTKEELEANGFGGVFDNPLFEVKELEQDNFGWVFSCEGVEVKEVE